MSDQPTAAQTTTEMLHIAQQQGRDSPMGVVMCSAEMMDRLATEWDVLRLLLREAFDYGTSNTAWRLQAEQALSDGGRADA